VARRLFMRLIWLEEVRNDGGASCSKAMLVEQGSDPGMEGASCSSWPTNV
jgi:hypothetical protein